MKISIFYVAFAALTFQASCQNIGVERFGRIIPDSIRSVTIELHPNSSTRVQRSTSDRERIRAILQFLCETQYATWKPEDGPRARANPLVRLTMKGWRDEVRFFGPQVTIGKTTCIADTGAVGRAYALFDSLRRDCACPRGGL